MSIKIPIPTENFTKNYKKINRYIQVKKNNIQLGTIHVSRDLTRESFENQSMNFNLNSCKLNVTQFAFFREDIYIKLSELLQDREILYYDSAIFFLYQGLLHAFCNYQKTIYRLVPPPSVPTHKKGLENYFRFTENALRIIPIDERRINEFKTLIDRLNV